MRFCDLRLSLERSPLARRVKRLYTELEQRGIPFRPHVWLAEEWFSPDGIPGIAMPFYLAHPRLERLERRIMREAEGGNSRWLMRILRHEAGHALDNAYRLRRRKRWREVFGPASLPYPASLSRAARQPALRSSPRRVVCAGASHRGFRRDLRRVAQATVELAHELRRLAGVPQAVARRRADGERARPARRRCATAAASSRCMPIRARSRSTIAASSRTAAITGAASRMSCCVKVFSAQRLRANAPRASTLLRAARTALVASVSRDLGVERYTVQQILRMLIERSEKLKLYIRGSRRDALRHARWMLARITRLYGQGETPHLPL